MTRPKQLSDRMFFIGASVFLALVLSYLLPVCLILRRGEELAVVPLAADLLLQGGLLYRDMFVVEWPGSFFMLALFFKLFGASWLTTRLVLLVELFFTGAVILILSRQLIRGPLVFLPAAIFVAVGPARWPYNSWHWDSVFWFVVLAAVLTLALRRDRPGVTAAASAGVIAGVGTVCFQVEGPAYLAALVAASLLIGARAHSRTAGVRFFAVAMAAFASVLGAVFIYLVATGTVESMIDSTFRFVFGRYHTVNAVPYGYSQMFERLVAATPSGPGTHLAAAITLVVTLLFCTPGELIKMAPFLVVLGVIIYFIRGGSLRQAVQHQPQVLLLLAMGSIFFIDELHRPDLIRLLWGGHMLLILVFYFFEHAPFSLPGTSLLVRTVIALIWLGVLAQLTLNTAVYAQPKMVLKTRRGTVASVDDYRIVEAVQRVTQPGEKVLVYPYDTTVNFLSQTRFPSNQPWNQYRYNSREQIQSTLDDLEASRVRYVVWDLSHGNESYRDLGFTTYEPLKPEELFVEKYLLSHYRFLKAYGHFRLMERLGASGSGYLGNSRTSRTPCALSCR